MPLVARLFCGRKSPSWTSEEGEVRPANFWDHAPGLWQELIEAVLWPVNFVADAYFSKEPFLKGLDNMSAISLVVFETMLWVGSFTTILDH